LRGSTRVQVARPAPAGRTRRAGRAENQDPASRGRSAERTGEEVAAGPRQVTPTRLSRLSDIETCDQAMLDPEDVANHLIDQHRSVEVANRLVDIDDDLAIGTGRKAGRLDVRVERGPLPGPIAPHARAAVNMPSLHAIGPGDIGMQRREH